MKIGENIRRLRGEMRITQEQLADAIGVSCQAVSKWETGTTMPDIAAVPRIAAFFGVTTDCLLAFDSAEMEADIERIAAKAFEFRESDPDRSRAIIENGLRKYPGSHALLGELLYVTDCRKEPDRVIGIASKLAAAHVKADIRYDAMRFMAYACSAKGDEAGAVAALEQVPQLYFTRLSETAFVASGKRKMDSAEKQRWISFETLLQMQAKLSESCEEAGDIAAARTHIRRALGLIGAMAGEAKLADFEAYRDYFEKRLEQLSGR